MRIIFNKWKKKSSSKGSKVESSRRKKEIFECEPVIYWNVKSSHLAILIWKSFWKVRILLSSKWESSSIIGRRSRVKKEAKWNQADKRRKYLKCSHQAILIWNHWKTAYITIWESSSISGRRRCLNNNAIQEAIKEQSGIKLTKEIFECKPVIYRNRQPTILIWKSF